MAKAMVDKDIEVLQVQRSGKTVFIEAHEKAAGEPGRPGARKKAKS